MIQARPSYQKQESIIMPVSALFFRAAVSRVLSGAAVVLAIFIVGVL